MTVKEYNEVWYPLINNSRVFLHAMEHNIQKADAPEEALSNLRILGWGPELKKFLNDAVSLYSEKLRNEAKRQTTRQIIEDNAETKNAKKNLYVFGMNYNPLEREEETELTEVKIPAETDEEAINRLIVLVGSVMAKNFCINDVRDY